MNDHLTHYELLYKFERIERERDELRAENERLRKASNAVLDFYHGPVQAKRPDVFSLSMRDLGDALERRTE